MLNGKSIKKVRRNKGYTQKYVAENIISQSSYSKFEADQSDIHSTAYIQLLERLDMTVEEICFIDKGFKHEQAQKIINNFFSLPYNDVTALEKVIVEINSFLKKQDNILLRDIKVICKALISLHTKKDINIVRKIVEPVWNRLSKHNQWYLSEIRLINTILYFFPNETALEISNNIIKRLELYDGFRDSEKQIITFKINLTLLLIKEGDYFKALDLLTGILRKHKKSMPYQSLAVCFARISICNSKLEGINGTSYMDQAQNLLQIYDDLDLWSKIQKEYEHYIV